MLRLRAGSRKLSGSEYQLDGRRARNSKTPTTITVHSITRNDQLALNDGSQMLTTDDGLCVQLLIR